MIGEKQLLQLTKRLEQLVKTFREAPETLQQKPEAVQPPERAKSQMAMFQTMQEKKSETLDDFKEVITAMTTNKGLGMIDSEWR